MTRSILIGKGRRVTLEELQCVASGDGVLELNFPEGSTCPENADEIAAKGIDEATAALASLSMEDGSESLSSAATIASLTILALNLSQGRILSTGAETEKMVTALVDIVNVSKANTGENNLRLPTEPSAFVASLAKLISSATDEETLKAALSTSTISRTVDLAVGGLATVQANSLCTAATPVAALSCERTSVNLHAFAEVKYDINRPHRGLITTAAALRAMLQGSKFATSVKGQEGSNDGVTVIPQQHGPAQESLKAISKTLELEINCFESNASDELDVTVATLALKQALDAVTTLIDGSKARTETSNGSVEAKSNCAFTLESAVEQLSASLQTEAQMGCEFCKSETEKAAKEAQEIETAKAARAAKAAPRDANAAGGEDEFAGMTEAQKKKILKKRAEKEAKAAKKAKAKANKGVTIFGAGTQSICDVLNGANFELTPDSIEQLDEVVVKLLSGGMQRKPKIAKGTRDYLPEQMMIRQQAFNIIRRVFQSHGAVEIDTPVFELKETLTGKYGEDSKLIYDLADQGGELLALRYDLTVPFARFLSLNPVGNIKRFHIGKVYRRDQPQLSKGRYREFYQCDFDIAGDYARMVPDSECLCVACEILDSLPIGDFAIKVNHRCLLDAILDICGVPADKFRTICSAVDKLDKEAWEDVKKEMVNDKGLAPEVADKIGEFVQYKGEPWALYKKLMEGKKFGKHAGALKAMEDLRICFEYLESMGKLQFISFDLSLARGLDYYTGIIYEAICMSGNTQVGSIGGGGRYDNLVSMFQEAGKQTPCVGVSVGIERVFTLMEAKLREEQGGSIKQPNVDVLVCSVGEGMMTQRMKVAKLLWDSKISAEFSQQDNPKLKFELKDALERGIPFMAIVGEDEVKENKCIIKDLKARSEESVAMEDVVSTLRKKGAIPVGCEFAAEMLAQESL